MQDADVRPRSETSHKGFAWLIGTKHEAESSLETLEIVRSVTRSHAVLKHVGHVCQNYPIRAFQKGAARSAVSKHGVKAGFRT